MMEKPVWERRYRWRRSWCGGRWPCGAVVGGSLGSVAGGVAGDANEAAKTDTPVGAGYNDVTPGKQHSRRANRGRPQVERHARPERNKAADTLTATVPTTKLAVVSSNRVLDLHDQQPL
jgi:hypothetical protein